MQAMFRSEVRLGWRGLVSAILIMAEAVKVPHLRTLLLQRTHDDITFISAGLHLKLTFISPQLHLSSEHVESVDLLLELMYTPFLYLLCLQPILHARYIFTLTLPNHASLLTSTSLPP